jgi:hypothetical protein|tara:strand:+ start:110 stop:373 length:264 start_codon:yes stop_codon:yes gene_type:complete
MSNLSADLKNYTQKLLGKEIVKAEAGEVSTIWFDNMKDAQLVNLILSESFNTSIESEELIEPHVEGMTREDRRNRKFIKTGLITVSY